MGMVREEAHNRKKQKKREGGNALWVAQGENLSVRGQGLIKLRVHRGSEERPGEEIGSSVF